MKSPKLRSMSFFRFIRIRRSISAAVLILGLFSQLQTVFACDLMEDQVSSTCCCEIQMEKGCENGGGCDASSSNTATDCCQTSLSTTVIDVVSVAPQEPVVLSHNSINAATLLLPLSTRLDPFPLITAPMASPDHDSRWQTGTDTYLATLRIRI